MVKSKINPLLTVEYMTSVAEHKHFDRKSGEISPRKVAALISAFANAEGGTIVFGINDDSIIEGINKLSEEKVNNLLNTPHECNPTPRFEEEFLDVVNHEGKADRLLLLHIESETSQPVIRTINGSTHLRTGDRIRELKGEDLRNLEYSKSARVYEDECSFNATLEDLDDALIQEYKKKINAEDIPTEQLLEARGLIRTINGEKRLTNACVLLFAKNTMQFHPNCRVRFIRYDGNEAHTGLNINIIKDQNFDTNILNLIPQVQEFVSTQLRDFMALSKETGKFFSVAEYPEFAWAEGIVNAITHREYGLRGDYILISMYENRLEIKSPGQLPDLVTVSNIKETRFSRNQRIARVLNEFGWVREVNEGVKRIYREMEAFFLEEPVYEEGANYVQLTLRNNIVMRTMRQAERTIETIGEELWNELDELEQQILTFMASNQEVTTKQLMSYTGKSNKTINERLKNLILLNIVKRNGKPRDPTQSYEFKWMKK